MDPQIAPVYVFYSVGRPLGPALSPDFHIGVRTALLLCRPAAGCLAAGPVGSVVRYGAGRRDHRRAGRASPGVRTPHSRVSPWLAVASPYSVPMPGSGAQMASATVLARAPDHPLGNAHISYREASHGPGARWSVPMMGVRAGGSVGSARTSRSPSSSGRGSARRQVRMVRVPGGQ